MTIRKALREPLMVPESRGAIWEDYLGNRGDIDPRASRECISPQGGHGPWANPYGSIPFVLRIGLVPMAPIAGPTGTRNREVTHGSHGTS